MHYVVKVHVPGVTGAIASLLGKIPSDSHVWILGGEAPAFVKSESPLFPGGSMWRIELVSPIWPSTWRDHARLELAEESRSRRRCQDDRHAKFQSGRSKSPLAGAWQRAAKAALFNFRGAPRDGLTPAGSTTSRSPTTCFFRSLDRLLPMPATSNGSFNNVSFTICGLATCAALASSQLERGFLISSHRASAQSRPERGFSSFLPGPTEAGFP